LKQVETGIFIWRARSDSVIGACIRANVSKRSKVREADFICFHYCERSFINWNKVKRVRDGESRRVCDLAMPGARRRDVILQGSMTWQEIRSVRLEAPGTAVSNLFRGQRNGFGGSKPVDIGV
jgi:hypothetical protein